MIFGNHALLHVDSAEYIRVAELGQLHAIAEEMGMSVLHNRLKEQMYAEVKGRIP